MAVKAWIAAHTGLPAFYSPAPARIVAGDRIIADGTRPVCVSDGLARLGVATTYLVDGVPVVLTRPAGPREGAIVADRYGRTVPGLVAVANDDPVSWDPGVSRTGHITRWPMVRPLATGTSLVLLEDPTLEASLWDILRQRAPLVIGPARETPGVPLRLVTLDAVSRQRIGMRGELEFQLGWTECPASQGTGAVPVVTWGEYEARYGTWTTGAYTDVLHDLAGMPV
ncbi:hypothetical protein [Actinobaculum sp. 352]|uniref:hypothetical protein n=1 Tax=Actinobaculum sp. 352 TaxID=2490946 RepID=UPI000F7E759D|nr:hypothetical protein [Actinobaculum sp. 352]RTE50386.1 hypothetical protein EKN07_04100 [Actinobaculum sp. 352]